MSMNYDYLDTVADAVRNGDMSAVDVLSTGEKVYVGLASNNTDILDAEGFSIVSGILRLEAHERGELVKRWQYR